MIQGSLNVVPPTVVVKNSGGQVVPDGGAVGQNISVEVTGSGEGIAALEVTRGQRLLDRAPLAWKYDHGSAFMSEIFQGLLEEHEIVPYPIAPRSPWVNGRTERDHQEVHNWLIPLAGRELSREALEREIDEEMLMRNFVKPRACLGFRKSAEVYFSEEAALEAEKQVREWLAQGLAEEKCMLGASDPTEVYEIRKSGERLHRKAARTALQKLGLYEEWDTAAPQGPSEAEAVNRSEPADVSF